MVEGLFRVGLDLFRVGLGLYLGVAYGWLRGQCRLCLGSV